MGNGKEETGRKQRLLPVSPSTTQLFLLPAVHKVAQHFVATAMKLYPLHS